MQPRTFVNSVAFRRQNWSVLKSSHWAPHSLKGEIELVIMVEVRIEEMFGSDRSRLRDYERAVVVDARVKEEQGRPPLAVNGEACSKSV